MKKIPVSAKIVFTIYVLLILFHIEALFNVDPSRGHFKPFFLIPIFFFSLMPFWILFIFKFNKIVKQSNNSYIFKQVRNSLPTWVLKLVIINIVYGIGSFVFSFATINLQGELNAFRAFSAHLSLFYVMAFAGLTGIANYRPRKCANGHEIKVEAQYCPECGIDLNMHEKN